MVSAVPRTASSLLPRRRLHAAPCLLSWHQAGQASPTRDLCLLSIGQASLTCALCFLSLIGRARPKSALCLLPPQIGPTHSCLQPFDPHWAGQTVYLLLAVALSAPDTEG